MILGIGNDLVSVARIEHLMSQFKEKFAQKIFTDHEISYASRLDKPSLFFAKRFAAKEAFSKAMGLGIGRGINFIDIEVVNNELGAPKIKVLNGKEEFIKKHFNCEKFAIHLSLTDENPHAAAYVIIEKIS